MAGMEDATPGTSSARRPSMGLGTQILIGMVLGSFLGAVLGARVTVIQPVGDRFIRLPDMQGGPVAVGVNGYGRHTHLATGPQNADGDLTSICDQDFHWKVESSDTVGDRPSDDPDTTSITRRRR